MRIIKPTSIAAAALLSTTAIAQSNLSYGDISCFPLYDANGQLIAEGSCGSMATGTMSTGTVSTGVVSSGGSYSTGAVSSSSSASSMSSAELESVAVGTVVGTGVENGQTVEYIVIEEAETYSRPVEKIIKVEEQVLASPPPPVAVAPSPEPAPVRVAEAASVGPCGGASRGDRWYGNIGAGYVFDDSMSRTIGATSTDIGESGWGLDLGFGREFGGLNGIGCDDRARVGLDDNFLSMRPFAGAGRSQFHNEFLAAEYAPDLGFGPLRPYIGAGVGIAGLDYSDGAGGAEFDWAFAYKGILGLAYEFSDTMEAYAEYNYIGSSDFDLEDGNGNSLGQSIAEQAHLGLLGLRFFF